MSFIDYAQILFFVLVFVGLTPLLGTHIADVFLGKRTFLHPILEWLERACYRICIVDETEEMTNWDYGKCILFFNLFGFLFLFLLQLSQGFLPLNPQNLPGVPWDLAFSAAASFVTNTNWQSYAGETTMTYLTQMLGLAVQNFLSAATGFGASLVFIRGFIRKSTTLIGNFWVDMVRSIVYILLPLAILLSILLISQGVVQTFSSYMEVATIEEGYQVIPLGPVASQVAIKQLGTNGGGFFNANSAHPFENPTGISNLLELLAILLIPSSLVYAFGVMVNSRKHAWILFLAMFFFWICGIIVSFASELAYNPVLEAYPVMEGKETRLGIVNSLLWSVSTTGVANGSVNAMLDSLSPMAGGIALFNIMIGELIFGGVGVGFCAMLMFVLLTVFLSGLMVGRTPEYLGKKIEKKEMQWVIFAILIPVTSILIGTGMSFLIPDVLESLLNKGPHGFSEMLYAFVSPAGNNGSAFAGINSNTYYFNIIQGFIFIFSRVSIIFSSLVIGGLLASKKVTPHSIGTFSTDTVLFLVLLIGVIFIEGALAFFPAFSLGPVAEQILMLNGRAF